MSTQPSRRAEPAPGPAEDAAVAAAPLLLPFTPPYDWDALLGFLTARALPGVEEVSGGVYRRSIALGAGHGAIAATLAPGRNALRVDIRFSDPAALPAIRRRLRRLFDLDADPGQIAAGLSADPHLAPLLAARPGLRVPGAWDGFEIALRAVLGQQISVAAATRLAARIAERYGTPLSLDGGLTRLFPAADQLLTADFRALGMPGGRARALTALAEAGAADPAFFDPDCDPAEFRARLLALPGIGPWTADYVAMRALRDPDAFLPSDIGVLRAMADDRGRRPSPAAMARRAEAWRPWRAYALLHLWTAEHAAPSIPQPGGQP